MSCGVGRRHGLDRALLWLWCRPVATAPIKALSWESPYAVGSALEKAKRPKKKKKRDSSVACSISLDHETFHQCDKALNFSQLYLQLLGHICHAKTLTHSSLFVYKDQIVLCHQHKRSTWCSAEVKIFGVSK